MNILDSVLNNIDNPKEGLPEDVFKFVNQLTPMVNVDLLIRDNNKTLLTWRGGGYYSPGWHMPGGIVRYKEDMHERIRKVARLELGAEIEFSPNPILINEIIRSPERSERGHFISFLYDCNLTSEPIKQSEYGEWKYFEKCPKDIIPVHSMYKEVINGEILKKECMSDFGLSRVLMNSFDL